MTSILHGFILGLIQGITEFLPISSSGHLVLAQEILPNFEAPEMLFDLFLHVGTLGAVVVAYRRDLMSLLRSILPARGSGVAGETCLESKAGARSFLLMIIVASIPTAIIGLLGEHLAETLFSTPRGVGVGLLVTAALIYGSERAQVGKEQLARPIRIRDALIIGTVQGLAIYPGLSRSGSTISTGLLLGLDRINAARFSFLLSVPAIAGAVLLKADDLISQFTVAPHGELLAWLVGLLTATVSGILAIILLLRLIRQGRFKWFAAYCAALGVLSLLVTTLAS